MEGKTGIRDLVNVHHQEGRGFSKCPPPRYKLQAGELVNAHHYGTHKVEFSKFPISLTCPTRGDLANFTTNVST